MRSCIPNVYLATFLVSDVFVRCTFPIPVRFSPKHNLTMCVVDLLLHFRSFATVIVSKTKEIMNTEWAVNRNKL